MIIPNFTGEETEVVASKLESQVWTHLADSKAYT